MGESEYAVNTYHYSGGAGADVDVLPANPQRVAVEFSASGSTGLVYMLAVGWSGDPYRFTVPLDGRVRYKCDEFGPYVGGAFVANGLVAGNELYIVEVVKLQRPAGALGGYTSGMSSID